MALAIWSMMPQFTRRRDYRPNAEDFSVGLTQFFIGQGDNAVQAKAHALGWIGKTIGTQATLLSYLDVFWAAAIFSALMVPVTRTRSPTLALVVS